MNSGSAYLDRTLDNFSLLLPQPVTSPSCLPGASQHLSYLSYSPFFSVLPAQLEEQPVISWLRPLVHSIPRFTKKPREYPWSTLPFRPLLCSRILFSSSSGGNRILVYHSSPQTVRFYSVHLILPTRGSHGAVWCSWSFNPPLSNQRRKIYLKSKFLASLASGKLTCPGHIFSLDSNGWSDVTASFEEQEETVITVELMAYEPPSYLYQPNSRSYLVFKSCSKLGI